MSKVPAAQQPSKAAAQKLLRAVKKGEVAAATALLDQGLDPDSPTQGYPLVAWAAEQGRVAIIDLLLERGATVDCAHPDGGTALCVAVRYARVDTAVHLIARGADPKRVVRGAWCLLAGVPSGEAWHFSPEFHQDGGVTLLMLAAMCDPGVRRPRSRDLAMLAYLLGRRQDQDVQARDDHGNTALMFASLGGRRDAAALLVEHGAEVDARNEAGHTALAHAVFAGDLPAVELLVGKGADPCARNHQDVSILDLARYARNEPAAEYLRRHGARG
jgi:ankyrin repeat protein